MSWKAGTASVTFTPGEPFWLAGYAKRNEPANSKISDLRAKAFALEDPTGERFLFLTIDLIAINPPIPQNVARAVGFPLERILFAASHTHYGPEIRPDKALFFGIPDDYAKRIPVAAEIVQNALIHVGRLALRGLKPSKLLVRSTTATFADNRRSHGDVTDHDVPILEVVAPDGAPRAILFGYACHNTTIPPEDCRYCADWAGFAQEQIERDHPGAIALFITGAAADQNPHPRGSVELSRQHGSELAGAVTASLASPGVGITGPLRAAYESVSLLLEPISRDEIERRAMSDDPPVARKAKFLLTQLAQGQSLITAYAVPLQVVAFGYQLLLIALAGEPVNDYAHLLKTGTPQILNQTSRAPMLWIAGYCNDMFGYLPTRRIQSEGGYEGGRANLWSWIPAPFDGSVEDRITTAVERLISKVNAP